MSTQDVPPWIKEQLERYEQLQQNLQAFLIQKQQIELEVVEIDKALSELEKAVDDSKVYKSAGTIMVSSSKKDAIKDLTESKELANSKLTLLDKQENRIKENLKEVQKKLDDSMKRGTASTNTE